MTARPLRYASARAPADIQSALDHLALALTYLGVDYADCPKAAASVRRAKKSVEGALRHAHRRRRKTLEEAMKGAD